MSEPRLELPRGDITKVAADAIVNAASRWPESPSRRGRAGAR
jgi:hypothetical protein